MSLSQSHSQPSLDLSLLVLSKSLRGALERRGLRTERELREYLRGDRFGLHASSRVQMEFLRRKRCLESVGGVQRRSEAVDDGAQRGALYGL
jgi:hypothetical protein